jgi:mycofactocin system glycosyltransferase
MSYRLAEGIQIVEQGSAGFLFATRPLRLLRLNPPLLRLTRRLKQQSVLPSSDAEAKVLTTLASRGFAVREWTQLGEWELPRVSIIIPVRNRPVALRDCLTSLADLDYPKSLLEVIVVDDGSNDHTPEVAREFGAVLVDSGSIGGGPAAARNRGALRAGGEILAFIDSDCTASARWLRELLPVFGDAKVAAVGGWVDGMHEAGALDRYEAVMSSLNLGRRTMFGGAGGDTFYLPSCNLLVWREAFSAVGGFRSELTVGEDVDLTWRLRDAGWSIVYLPKGAVCHAHRNRLRPFMKRRFDYGTSEGLLQRLHPVRGKTVLLPPVLAAILFLVALSVLGCGPLPLLMGAILFAGDVLATRRRVLRQGMTLDLAAILAARGRAAASLAYYVGYHLLRYYLVPLLLTSCFYPPVGVLVLLVLLGVATVDHRVRRARLFLPLFWGYYFLEQLSYGAGVFWGCLRQRTFASYKLQLQTG